LWKIYFCRVSKLTKNKKRTIGFIYSCIVSLRFSIFEPWDTQIFSRQWGEITQSIKFKYLLQGHCKSYDLLWVLYDMVSLKSPQQFAGFSVTLVKILKFETLCNFTHLCKADWRYLLLLFRQIIRKIGHLRRISTEHGCWLELSIRQETFSHFLSRQCGSFEAPASSASLWVPI
jgi:hypothetical protein